MASPAPHSPSRVLVADDSGFMRRVLSSALRSGGFEVVGEARDGDEALRMWAELKPDAMTLDLAMPGTDGIGVLRALRQAGERSVPVVVVSAFSPTHGARAVDALAEGAFDLVSKPAGGDGLAAFTAEIGEKVRAATHARSGRTAVAADSLFRPVAATPVRAARPRPRAPRPRRAGHKPLVLIASSTGGPRALGELVPFLPSPLGAGGLIVQHMPPGFTSSLADRLDRASALNVVEATGGEVIRPDTILLAPGGSHLRLGADKRAKLSDEPPIGALRPRADLTIEDAAALYGDQLLLVVLTGMGRDGTEGAKAVKAAGGRVLVEAESTCTVYGMPRAVVEADLADAVHPLDELPAAIKEELNS
ncbi:chemotaxis-specific protein-glutamate methyltransferase CheB [Paraconexibacter antarcticus]|uniref:Protein-glutamate methylesterase/protein-glutamine glutaminase n=1 Tax=Paraconexibacter antarcticus TaxID=2949664 RepID=A0ABY5DUA8_9ACTN|nr:chemotaxis-specific protein-glutamate methyltransferase CheB [Paraconexibacter antarcticus]UTI64672.1 chemotaxis-specific protein-glutamate methyltransferase CheB [Paraconexibacter antarcticus]